MLAIPVGFVAALVVWTLVPAPDSGPDLLRVTKQLAFTAIFVSAFCFPARTRWFHAAALLGLGIAAFCLMRPIDYQSYQWHGLPNFRSIVLGGSFAILAHMLIDLLVLIATWPNQGAAANGLSAVRSSVAGVRARTVRSTAAAEAAAELGRSRKKSALTLS
ncbi:MAG: hypothetical protein FGM15_10700 [Chthoniobacterales bacterium]|nr:hypothetical protein [Chthoniobacterales bacterium]